MLEALKAIVAKGESSPTLLALLPGEFWTRRAPQGTPRPYMVILPLSGESSYETSDRVDGEDRYTFQFIGDTISSLAPIVRAWREAFDQQPLTLVRGRSMNVSIADEQFVDEPPPEDELASCYVALDVVVMQQKPDHQ